MRFREYERLRANRTALWIDEDTPCLCEITSDMGAVNSEVWAGMPKGAVRIAELSCSGPSWWERLWAWWYGRRAVYQVKVVFSIEPGLSDPMESKR